MAANHIDFLNSKQFDNYFTDVHKLHQSKVLQNSISPTDVLPVAVLKDEKHANEILVKLKAPVVSVAKAISSLFHVKTDKSKEPTPTQDHTPKKRF